MKRGREEDASEEEAINVFIDLDDTLVSRVVEKAEETKGDSEDIIRFRKDRYRLAHGAREFLLALNGIPNLRIHFYSFGMHKRNLCLTKRIVAHSLSRYTVISPRSRDCLSASFPKYKKLRLSNNDLEESLVMNEIAVESKEEVKEIYSPMNLERSILIDDRAYFVAPGEETNCIHVYKFSYSPQAKFVKDNNLIRVLGLILFAIKLSSEFNCSFVAALTAIQWDEKGAFRHKGVNDMAIYKMGIEEMRKFNPQLDLKGNPDIEDYLNALEDVGCFSFGHEPEDEQESAMFRLNKIASQRHPIDSCHLKP